ncbi:MAG: hypothetical protein WDA16_04345 [Candidatus Thermoplasmatota archaeon]
MFHWKKGTNDEDAITTYDPRDTPPWTASEDAQSKRHKRRHAGAPMRVDASAPTQVPETTLEVDAEIAALAQRLQELGTAFARERAASEARVSALTSETARATEGAAQRVRNAETEVERLRLELSQKDEAMRAEREETSVMRRRVEGFEGLKRAMQSL